MRVLFLSDFHGRIPDLSEWQADLILAGGDYCEVDEIRQLKFAALGRGWPVAEWPRLVGRARADELMERALAEGAAVVAALADDGRPVLAIPGNSDRLGVDREELAERFTPRPDRPSVAGRVTNIDGRVVVRDGLAFAGLGGWSGPANPQRLEQDLAALRAGWERVVAELARTHQPPRRCSCSATTCRTAASSTA